MRRDQDWHKGRSGNERLGTEQSPPWTCMDPQPQESGKKAPPPQPGTPQGALPCLMLPSMEAHQQHLCVLARGSAVSPGKSGRLVGWGRGEQGAAGSGCDKNAECSGLLQAESREAFEALSCEAEALGKLGTQRGLEQAACLRSGDGHMCVLLDKANFPPCFCHT